MTRPGHPRGCSCNSCSNTSGVTITVPGGPQGVQGIQGRTGSQGIRGTQGTQGTQGTGSQGFQGVQGRQGTQGTSGTIGTQGTQGATGSGAQGVQGVQGIQGSSELETALNVLYVSKSGNDSNDGTSLARAKLTVKSALQIATAGTTVYVKSGTYYENNPVTIPANVSLVGDNLRTTTIRPNNQTQDIFYVNNGNYITGLAFRGHLAPAAAIAFNPNGSAGNIITSPYINNCSSVTTTGTGMRIDGSVVGGGKSMLAAQFTQFNSGGKGIHILNRGYAQLISIYTICCDIGVLCESGGFCSLIGSDTSFGNFGLKATGVSELLYSGTAPTVNKNETEITISGLSQTPFVNNVVTFDNGTNYYTIKGVTPVSGGSSTITLVERIKDPVSSGTSAKFYQSSRITAAGHTFEYCGSGTNVATALPQAGGIPNQETEVIEELGGEVYYTSTDQLGDFRIGGDLTINRGTGTITGVTFDKSLFAVMTPYILAIEG